MTRFRAAPRRRILAAFRRCPTLTREAYSHEVSSAGFWPGGGGVIDFPAFYSYAYPAPEGFAEARPAPDAAYFETRLGEFVLPYDAVRTSSDPDATLMAFLQSTYAAAADLGGWNRAALEGPMGVPRRPRPCESEQAAIDRSSDQALTPAGAAPRQAVSCASQLGLPFVAIRHWLCWA